MSDGAEHVLEPRFTYYGYRYVKVEVDGEAPEGFDARDFTGIALYSDFETASGTIETGNPLVNQLVSNTRWGMRGNFVDTPTDCPQRDERMGWTGDAQVFSATALYLGRLDARLESAAGDWRVAWKILDERHLRVEIEVPFGATAEVELPLAPDAAYDELGGRVLAVGTYAVEHETTESLRRMPSADWTLARLMGSPDTYRTLLRYVRHPVAVPADEAAAKTVRELAVRMGLDDGRLAALDADLGALAE